MPPAQPTHSSHALRTAADDANTINPGCTYRHFLSLCWPTVAVSHRSARGFALGRALHFDRIPGRVVYPSQYRQVSMQEIVVAVVQSSCALLLDPWTRLSRSIKGNSAKNHLAALGTSGFYTSILLQSPRNHQL
jgi:hypothetical protein